MCSYGQLSEVQMVRDLDLGSGQSHVNTHSMCTTYTPNHMTVALRSTEICGHLYVVKYRHSVKFEL